MTAKALRHIGHTLHRHCRLRRFSSSCREDDIDGEPPPRLPSQSRARPATSRHQTRSHQRGYGKIVALSSRPSPSAPVSTHLTDVRHASPLRIVPSRRSPPPRRDPGRPREGGEREAALLHLSSYGGGLVPGDSLHLDVDVRGEGAVVCVLTQGGQRVYRPGEATGHMGQEASKPCQSTVRCTIEPGGTLLYLPDPTVPYHRSSFRERRAFTCQHSPGGDVDQSSMGSVVAVDWYSSGRRHSAGMEGERWAFEYLATRTELFVVEEEDASQPAQARARAPRPVVIESMEFDNKLSDAKRASTRTHAAIALGKDLDAMATILLHGPSSLPVTKRAESLSRRLAALRTRTRSDDDDDDAIEVDEMEDLLVALGGKVLLSVTPIENREQKLDERPQTHMVRILAESNEDIYRILHCCLKPCSHYLGGLEPYRERIHSSRSIGSDAVLQRKQANGSVQTTSWQRQEERRKQSKQEKGEKPNLQRIANKLVFGNDHDGGSLSSEAWFRLCTLADSSLPVGSFAHSLGLEAASQMGLFADEGANDGDGLEGKWSAKDGASSCSAEALSDYIHAVARSNALFSTPPLLAGYCLAVPGSTDVESAVSSVANAKKIHRSWLDIDDYLDALLRSNSPGRTASMDQGLGLLRIAPSFDLTSRGTDTSELLELIRRSIDRDGATHSNESVPDSSPANGHAPPIYGILAALLGIPPLDACRVFAFGAARDTVSAAVRLNLVGPVAGLSILDGVGRGAVEEGLEEGLTGMLRDGEMTSCEEDGKTREERLEHWLRSTATCAPVLDTVQPLHDLLSVRLFRT